MSRRRQSNSLASLEQRLAQLNEERQTLITRIQDAVRQLTEGAGSNGAARSARRVAARSAGPVKRHFSAAARAKLRASAKARWAAAKKAGRTRLG